MYPYAVVVDLVVQCVLGSMVPREKHSKDVFLQPSLTWCGGDVDATGLLLVLSRRETAPHSLRVAQALPIAAIEVVSVVCIGL